MPVTRRVVAGTMLIEIHPNGQLGPERVRLRGLVYYEKAAAVST